MSTYKYFSTLYLLSTLLHSSLFSLLSYPIYFLLLCTSLSLSLSLSSLFSLLVVWVISCRAQCRRTSTGRWDKKNSNGSILQTSNFKNQCSWSLFGGCLLRVFVRSCFVRLSFVRCTASFVSHFGRCIACPTASCQRRWSAALASSCVIRWCASLSKIMQNQKK